MNGRRKKRKGVEAEKGRRPGQKQNVFQMVEGFKAVAQADRNIAKRAGVVKEKKEGGGIERKSIPSASEIDHRGQSVS